MTPLSKSEINHINGGFFWETLVAGAYVYTAAAEGFEAANCLVLGYIDGVTGGDHSDQCGG